MERLVVTALNVAIVAMGLGFAAAPAVAEPGDVREAIEASNRSFMEAFGRGDAEAVAGLYTQDAQLVPPGAPIVNGRADIASFWRGAMDSGLRSVTLQTTGVESAGDLAYEMGTARLESAEGAASEARYVVVWKRVGDAWKLHRDIWNAPR